ncbi:MAG: pyridoxal 5'-phosphate synthase glutaminase subunit PdxT [bacterium]
MRSTIGVLALQGSFPLHIRMLARTGRAAREVRVPEHLEGLSGLVIPGGESTTVEKLIVKDRLDEAIRERFRDGGLALFGTCMGLIVLSRGIEGSRRLRLGLLDVAVARNAYGRQRESFEAAVALNGLAGEPEWVGGTAPVTGVFIRAPVITRTGAGVRVLAVHGGRPVLVREGNALGAAFHPELTEDARIHEYFARIAENAGGTRGGGV